MTEHSVDRPPLIITKPKRVNRDLQGPLIEPPAVHGAPVTAEPIWGNTVRLLHGARDRWDGHTEARILARPGHRQIYRDEEYEPNGQGGTSYGAYMETLRACFRAGWTPQQADVLLTSTRVGPGAQHRWQQLRQARETWFLDRWAEVAMTERTTYYARQVAIQVGLQVSGNRSHPAGPITRKVAPAGVPEGWVYSEDRLMGLWRYLVDHPGQHQDQVKTCGVVAPRAVVLYLDELQRQGLATVSTVPTGRRGRPPRIWAAVGTPVDRPDLSSNGCRLSVEDFAALVDGLSG